MRALLFEVDIKRAPDIWKLPSTWLWNLAFSDQFLASKYFMIGKTKRKVAQHAEEDGPTGLRPAKTRPILPDRDPQKATAGMAVRARFLTASGRWPSGIKELVILPKPCSQVTASDGRRCVAVQTHEA